MTSILLINSMLDRAEHLLSDLEVEYNACLRKKDVSNEALNLTHEILEKCSNVLDQLMTLAWETRIKPNLTELPNKGGYFPVAKDENSYRSGLGVWKVPDLQNIDPDFDQILRKYQPMSDEKNNWISDLRNLANRKHTGLVPQTRTELKRISVTRPGAEGGVSWGPGVTFGKGVSVMGAEIDPNTQLPKPGSGVETKIEIWVSFIIADTSLNALNFCRRAVSGTKSIIEDFKISLSLP